MVVAGAVEELLEVAVHLDVVLARGHLEVGDPGQLAIDVTLLTSQGGPGGHTGAADGVFFKGIKGLLGSVGYELFLLTTFVKVLLKGLGNVGDLPCRRCGCRC